MSYEEFKAQIVEVILSNEEFANYRVEIIEEGYNAYDAKKKHFWYTNTIDEFEDWLYNTNLSLFQGKSDKLLGDILIISNKEEKFVRFQMKSMYEEFASNGDMEVNKLYATIKEKMSLLNTSRAELLAKHSTDYDMVKNILIIRPLSYEICKEELKNSIYRLENDIALVLYFDLTDQHKKFVLSTKVPKSHLEKWGKSADEVIDEALINTHILQQPRLFNVFDLHSYTYKPCVSKEGAFMAINIDPADYEYDIENLLALTTTQKTNGAVALYYRGVKEKIAEIVGGDYYVFFAETVAAYILSVNEDIEKMITMVETCEKEKKIFMEMQPQESRTKYLGYVYKYDAKRKILLKVDNLEQMRH